MLRRSKFPRQIPIVFTAVSDPVDDLDRVPAAARLLHEIEELHANQPASRPSPRTAFAQSRNRPARGGRRGHHDGAQIDFGKGMSVHAVAYKAYQEVMKHRGKTVSAEPAPPNTLRLVFPPST
jgi:hypothetical protein